MARFFVDELPREGTVYILTGENAAHAKVLRLKPGEEVTLCDGRGTDCLCTVEDGLTLRVGAPLPCPAEPRVRVVLYLAFPKADKAEHVIQKATELGAAEKAGALAENRPLRRGAEPPGRHPAGAGRGFLRPGPCGGNAGRRAGAVL